LFDEAAWLYNTDTNYSKAANSPFLNQTLNGKVWLTCNHNQYYKSN
jgi:dihydroorotase-like cyclic amidohydrolase